MKMTKTELKEKARDILFDSMVGNAGYEFDKCYNGEGVCECHGMTEEEKDELTMIMKGEATRVAKLFAFNVTKDEITLG